MAKLPSFKRLYEQDFPEDQQSLVQQLAVTINSGFEVLYEQLNGKLVLNENLAAYTKEITVTVGTTGLPIGKTSIKKTSTDRIQGISVIRVDNLTNSSTYPSTAVFISFTETTDSIIINHITGLVAGNLYRINVKIER